MKLEPCVLEGEYVRLEPLANQHRDGLCEAIRDGQLWKLFVTLVPRIDDVPGFIDNALAAHANNTELAFATIDKTSGRVAGSTRFMKADFNNRRIEIGYTFVGKTWQRTAINTQAKLLMLGHAFEYWNLNRVEFLTDYLNNRSRTAILRLGAKQEGILRNHMLMPDGRVRDSVIFSIIKNEWAGIKQHLTYKLAEQTMSGTP